MATRSFVRRRWAPALMCVCALVLLAAAIDPSAAAPKNTPAADASSHAADPAQVAADRAAAGVPEPGAPTDAAKLPDAWWRSTDVAYDAHPTTGGYEIVVAREAERWEWRPLATIRPAGLGDITLTGYHCLTGDGAWIVAVVAPVEAINTPWVRDRGGWAYRVSTQTGEVTPLRGGVAVKYHTPGCGTGADVALVSHLEADQERTRVEVVDVASTKTAARFDAEGQLTNAVPDGDRVVAARDKGVVAFNRGGKENTIAETPGTPFQLRGVKGGVAFLVADRDAQTSQVWAAAGDKATAVGRGPLTTTNLAAGSDGAAFAVGPDVAVDAGAPVRAVATSASTGERVGAMSRQGHLALVEPRGDQTKAATLDGESSTVPHSLAVRPDTDETLSLAAAPEGAAPPPAASDEVAIPLFDANDPEMGPGKRPETITGPDVAETQSSDADASPPAEVIEATPAAYEGSEGSVVPAVYDPNTSAAKLTETQFTTPTCAVPRNALNRQVPQPNAAQVDWAIQQATRNNLKNSVLTRPANYANLGLVAYQPSSDFPRNTLMGSAASVPVPPSVIQGTYAQESNWKQASQRALPGVSGNPLIGDYYGSGGTLDVIAYENADCGYGISQVTDPMTVASGAYSANGKAKVAVDYAENVAAGLQFLVDKWNVLYGKNTKFNGADPQYLENWWGALWAYNSGWNAPDANGFEGLGWTNNPINADYPANRQGFLRATYADAAHPGDWSYPERVAGWMEHPQLDYTGTAQYNAPVYGGLSSVSLPPIATFCTDANGCNPSYLNGSLSFCTRTDRHCWWKDPVSWATCPGQCATSTFPVATTATEPAGANNYPPNCNQVPASADPTRSVIVVDDQPSNLNVEGCSTSGWSNSGTFTVAYGTDTSGAPLGQIDWHQLGTGFGGHTWFTKNRVGTDTPRINTGTWTPTGLTTGGLYTVQVHIPPSGASTPTAHYKVWTSTTSFADRYVDQHLHENRWVPLGSFNLGAGAKVQLSNVTGESANYTTNVAFDAVAFVPVVGTAASNTVEAVAVFDSNQNLDTTASWLIDSPLSNETKISAWADDLINGSGTSNGILDYTACGGTKTSSCVGSATRTAATTWQSSIASQTKPEWMGYSNVDPPKAPTSTYFDDPTKLKQRNKLTFDYLVSGGNIVPGSMVVTATHMTGTGHMPPFVVDFMHAVATDYGVPMPNLTTSLVNVGTYSHATSTVDPSTTGEIPGRAYRPYVSQPVYNGGCAQVASIDGGANPWKAYLNEGGVAGGVEAWVNLVADKVAAGQAPEAVHHMAAEIYETFFSNDYAPSFPTGLTYKGSIFRKAPAIWVEQNVLVCANGTVVPASGNMANASYMPDLYSYIAGHAVNATGATQSGTGTATPILTGNFTKFANPQAPLATGDDNPWGQCGHVSGEPRSGNPWTMDLLTSDEAKGDAVTFCYTTGVHDHGY